MFGVPIATSKGTCLLSFATVWRGVTWCVSVSTAFTSHTECQLRINIAVLTSKRNSSFDSRPREVARPRDLSEGPAAHICI